MKGVFPLTLTKNNALRQGGVGKPEEVIDAISKQGKGRHDTVGDYSPRPVKGKSSSDSRTESGMRLGPGLHTALVNGALQWPPPGTAPGITSSRKRGFQPFRAEP